jgi:hypothetical protein
MTAGRVCDHLSTESLRLRAAIARSGLSARAFAAHVLTRDERTVRRWLAGDSPIPVPVLQSRWLDPTSPIPDVIIEWLAGA